MEDIKSTVTYLRSAYHLEVQSLAFTGAYGFRINGKLSSIKPFLELLTMDVITLMTANAVITPNGIICVNVVHIRKSLNCIIVAP